MASGRNPTSRSRGTPARPKFRSKQEELDAIVSRAVPSQIPTNITKESYNRMLLHCVTENGLWACAKNGARVKAKMWYRSVIDRESGQVQNTRIPVAVLYCGGCDVAPNATADEPIFADQIQTSCL